MKLAIKLKLIKCINEYYFRNFQDTEFTMVTEDISEVRLKELFTISGQIDLNLFNMVEDLFECMYGKVENPNWLSGPAIIIHQDAGYIKNRVESDILNQDILEEVVEILKISENACLVGGAIRDLATGKDAKDYDFVTDTSYEELESLFADADFQVTGAGKQFLVLNVAKDGQHFEIANFRRDQDNSGAKIGNIKQDGNRRDFYCNALYYNLTAKKITDPTGHALRDIDARIIRFIGNANDRINQDPARVFRFYRFLATKDFKADKKSLKICRAKFNYAMQNTDSNRVREEIERMI